MAFAEVQLDVNISFGARGGPEFETDIVTTDSKAEFRNANIDIPLSRWMVGHNIKTRTEFNLLVSFFRIRKGRLTGFRFKDWMDFRATDEVLVLDGSRTVQLIKSYVSVTTDTRNIVKPTASPAATFRRNASPFSALSLDTTTGVVTLTADIIATASSGSTIGIDDITQANPGVVTTAVSHNLVTGDVVKIEGVVGMTEVNDLSFSITVLSGTTFDITVDTTGFTAYVVDAGDTVFHQGISRTNPVRLRAVAHGLTAANLVEVTGVVGMTEINNLVGTVTVVDVDRITLDIDASLFTEYTSGGTISEHLQPGSDVLDWTGEFDVPVRFDTDFFDGELNTAEVRAWPGIPIRETRDFV